VWNRIKKGKGSLEESRGGAVPSFFVKNRAWERKRGGEKGPLFVRSGREGDEHEHPYLPLGKAKRGEECSGNCLETTKGDVAFTREKEAC